MVVGRKAHLWEESELGPLRRRRNAVVASAVGILAAAAGLVHWLGL